jgi:hypothetical protein
MLMVGSRVGAYPGDVVTRVVTALRARAAAILVRSSALDARFPDTADLDVLAVADVEEFRSERLHVAVAVGPPAMVDVAWIPWAWLESPREMAKRGWVPHRVLSSELVFDSGRDLARRCEAARRCLYEPSIQRRRLKAFLDIGSHTVREIGVTWDFPALALFWLHMAHAACLGALLDGRRRLCPNVYTRPFDYLEDVEREDGSGARRAWIEALRLDVDPEVLIAALRRIHAVVAARYPEPGWPDAIGQGARYEYRYWLSVDEVSWRIDVAREMVRRHEPWAGVFYLRFCAYALARIPMIHEEARRGDRDVSFLRPERAVRPALERLAPGILDDLGAALGGNPGAERHDVERSLSMLLAFRDFALHGLRERGAPVPDPGTWAPYEPETLGRTKERHT